LIIFSNRITEGQGKDCETVLISPLPFNTNEALPLSMRPIARWVPHTLIGSKFAFSTNTGAFIIPLNDSDYSSEFQFFGLRGAESSYNYSVLQGESRAGSALAIHELAAVVKLPPIFSQEVQVMSGYPKRSRKFLEIEIRAGAPVRTANATIIPFATSYRLMFPARLGGVVYNRPTSIYVSDADGQELTIPVQDITRIAQFAVWGAALAVVFIFSLLLKGKK
jgi:hypothetical protein